MKEHKKNIIITGASKGIGLAIAKKLSLVDNTRLLLVSRKESALAQALDAVLEQAPKANVLAYAADLRNEDEVNCMIAYAKEQFGSIHVLINNAGANYSGNVEDLDAVKWDVIIDSYLKGTFLCSKAVIDVMKQAQEAGHIINISSIAAKKFVPGSAAYCAAKFGLMGFSHSLSEEIKEYGIKVSTVCPGRVDTSSWANSDADRSLMLKPEDVAEAVFFVLSQPEHVVISDLLVVHRNLK